MSRTRWDMRQAWLAEDRYAYAMAFVFLMDCVAKARPDAPCSRSCRCAACIDSTRLDADVPER